MIVDPGHSRHGYYTQDGRKELFFEIIRGIVKLYPAIVCTRAVEQHQTEYRQYHHKDQQGPVRPVFLHRHPPVSPNALYSLCPVPGFMPESCAACSLKAREAPASTALPFACSL